MSTLPTDSATSGPATSGATMRALFKHHAGEGLAFDRERSMPTGSTGKAGVCGPNDVLIRVHKAGVCGTDRHIWEWDKWSSGRVPVGIVTGHEFVGIVEAIGSAVDRVRVGQRVSGEGHISSMTDFNALTGDAHVARDMQIIGVDRDGCFADYLMMPQSNVWMVHDDIPDDHAAVFDPLGNAVHTVMSAGASAKSVLVTGAGIIGLMAVTVARAAGATRVFVTDVDPKRLALARTLGADEAFDVREGDGWIDEIDASTPGDGVDVLLEMSGAPKGIDAGFRALRSGGTAALLGIPAEPPAFDLTNHIVFKGATVIGVNGRRMWETWFQAEQLLLSGRIDLDPIITHVLPFADYARAFELMRSGEGIKVVLDINGATR
ncbi:MAG: L-threonine 3-dehydrogenase [Planctomycetota bacterium]